MVSLAFFFDYIKQIDSISVAGRLLSKIRQNVVKIIRDTLGYHLVGHFFGLITF